MTHLLQNLKNNLRIGAVVVVAKQVITTVCNVCGIRLLWDIILNGIQESGEHRKWSMC